MHPVEGTAARSERDKKLETKSIASKAMQYRQDTAGYSYRHAHYVSGVNNYLNSNHTKYLAELSGRFFFAFWKIYAANLLIL